MNIKKNNLSLKSIQAELESIKKQRVEGYGHPTGQTTLRTQILSETLDY